MPRDPGRGRTAASGSSGAGSGEPAPAGPAASVLRRQAVPFLVALLVAAAAAFWYLGSTAAGPGYALRGMPLDDSWIHMVYARSIASGTPFQYNPGEWETGATSPLWALLLSPAFLLGLPPVGFAKGLGIALTAAAAAAGRLVARRAGEPLAGNLFLIALPALPYMTFAAVSGTEVPLFVLLSLLCMERALAGGWTGAGVVAGLAILARPEGYLLLPLLAAALLAGALGAGGGPKPIGPALARLGALVGAALAVNSPWIAYCLFASGRPLPATFYAKSAWFGLFDTGQLGKIGTFLLAQPLSGSTMEGIFRLAGAALGAVLLAAGLRALHARGWSAVVLPGLFAPLFLYALSTELPLGSVRGPEVPGSIMNFYYARYMLPAVPSLMLVSLIGFSWILSRAGGGPAGPAPAAAEPRGRRRRRQRSSAGRTGRPGPAARAVLGAALLLPIASAAHQHGLLGPIYSWNCQNIEELEVASSRWIAENLPGDAVVAVSDAGASRFFGGRRVVDLVGLNSHRLLPLLAEINGTERRSPEEARLREELFRREPLDHVAVIRGWHSRLLRDRRVQPLRVFRLERNTICGGSELLVGRMIE